MKKLACLLCLVLALAMSIATLAEALPVAGAPDAQEDAAEAQVDEMELDLLEIAPLDGGEEDLAPAPVGDDQLVSDGLPAPAGEETPEEVPPEEPADPEEPGGTDSMYVGSHWTGQESDGYAENYTAWKNGQRPGKAFGEGALTIQMDYDASGISIRNALLQLCIETAVDLLRLLQAELLLFHKLIDIHSVAYGSGHTAGRGMGLFEVAHIHQLRKLIADCGRGAAEPRILRDGLAAYRLCCADIFIHDGSQYLLFSFTYSHFDTCVSCISTLRLRLLALFSFEC